jgi:transposase
VQLALHTENHADGPTTWWTLPVTSNPTTLRDAPTEGGKPGPNSRERALLAELEEVKAALGEAHVELRVWKRSAELFPPSRTSR